MAAQRGRIDLRRSGAPTKRPCARASSVVSGAAGAGAGARGARSTPSCSGLRRGVDDGRAGGERLVADEGTTSYGSVSGTDQSSSFESKPGLHDKYELRGKIGEGAFACVYAAVPRTDEDSDGGGRGGRGGGRGAGGAFRSKSSWKREQFAVKILDLRPKGSDASGFDSAPDSKKLEAADMELSIAQRVSGRNVQHVARSVAAFFEGSLAYLVMERYDQTLLSSLERMPKMDEPAYKRIFREMLLGVGVVNGRGIAHRDIKPDNFMCTDSGTIKLCDFGFASIANDESGRPQLRGIYGTPPFMAPDMLRGERYGCEVDPWATGVVFYVLLFGSFPYRCAGVPSGQAMKAAILSGQPAPTFEPAKSAYGVKLVSDIAAALTRGLLTRPLERRLSAAAALREPFFSEEVSPERSWVSLRQSLHAAKRIGAFDLRGEGASTTKKASPLDVRLANLQDKHRRQRCPAAAAVASDTAPCVVKACRGSDDASTQAGSEQDSSWETLQTALATTTPPKAAACD